MRADAEAGLDLGQLEDAPSARARRSSFSNPNNPAGVVYFRGRDPLIAALARNGATVIADQLYSRLRYSNVAYTHLRATGIGPPT